MRKEESREEAQERYRRQWERYKKRKKIAIDIMTILVTLFSCMVGAVLAGLVTVAIENGESLFTVMRTMVETLLN